MHDLTFVNLAMLSHVWTPNCPPLGCSNTLASCPTILPCGIIICRTSEMAATVLCVTADCNANLLFVQTPANWCDYRLQHDAANSSCSMMLQSLMLGGLSSWVRRLAGWCRYFLLHHLISQTQRALMHIFEQSLSKDCFESQTEF